MTRGRAANTAHLIADSVQDAREQWVAVFARDRADLGPAHAAELAAREADRYAQQRPLGLVLGELRAAWTVEADAQIRLDDAQRRCALLRDLVDITAQREATVAPLREAYERSRDAATDADTRLAALEKLVTTQAGDHAAALRSAWDGQRDTARAAAWTVRDGTGRVGQRRAAVREAREYLQQWSAAWQPYLPHMPRQLEQVVGFAAWFDDTRRHQQAFDQYARAAAEHAHPDYAAASQAAQHAQQAQTTAWRKFQDADRQYWTALHHYGSLARIDNPAERLTITENTVAAEQETLTAARDQIAALRTEPALRAQPPDVIEAARTQWASDRDERAAARAARAAAAEHQQHTAAAGRGWDAVSEHSVNPPSRGIGI